MKAARLCTLLVTLAGCFDDRDVEGSGRLVDVQTDVAAFHGVSVSDGLHAEIAIGPQSVALHLDDNIVDHVRVEVRGGVLFIEARERDVGFDPSAGAVVRVVSPTIDGVTVLDGSMASAEARGQEVTVRSDDGATLFLDARAAGVIHALAGDGASIVLNGTAPELDLDTSDGSSIESGVLSEVVAVRSRDGSTVRAHATKSVHVRAFDGSNVRIEGNPGSRDVSASDGSSVEFAD